MKKNNSAFTLVELMVAIAIIGILAAVVLVSMTSYRNRAKETAALQTASSVMPAAMKCALELKTMNSPLSPTDGGGPICDGSNFTWPSLNTSSTKGWAWTGVWGDSSNPNGYSYNLCGPNGVCESGGKFIGCPVTEQWWNNNYGIGLGTCAVGSCINSAGQYCTP